MYANTHARKLKQTSYSPSRVSAFTNPSDITDAAKLVGNLPIQYFKMSDHPLGVHDHRWAALATENAL